MTSLREKQSTIDGLVTSISLARGNILPWHLEDIDAVERGLKTDLKKLVDHCKHAEMDLKIAAMQRVLTIIKKTNDI